LYHLQKSQTLLSNLTMLLSLSINLSKTLIKSWLLTMKLFMISASELLNSPPQPMVT
jgi:diacylglycerol kinase